MTVRGYQLAVDWSRHGAFEGALEDVSGYVLDEPPVTVSWGRTEGRATEAAAAGKLTAALRNDGREFSPENTTSPIAGQILPGRRTRLQVDLAGTLHTLIDGVLDDITVDPHAAARDVTLNALDGWGVPGSQPLSTPVYTGQRTGDLINIVLDAAGWTGPRDIDPGATVVPYWWEEGTDAAAAVTKLVQSEGPPAVALVEAGTFVFRDRHHRLGRAASMTSQGTYTHVVPPGSGPADAFKILAGSFVYDHGLRNIANAVTFEVQQRGPAAVAEVWSTDTPIVLAAGQSVTVDAQASDPFILASTPVQDTDYELSAGSVTVTMSRDSGQSTQLTLTAGASATVVTRLAVRAVPLTVRATTKVTESDPSSIGTYGRQTWPHDAPWASVHDARAIAQRIIAVYATNRPVVTLSVAGLDDTYLQQILTRRIGDRVTIRNDEIGLNGDFMVERITHTIRKLGVIHRLELVCQAVDPTQPADVLTFDVAGKGFDQGRFGVQGIDAAGTMFRFDAAGVGFDQGRFAS